MLAILKTWREKRFWSGGEVVVAKEIVTHTAACTPRRQTTTTTTAKPFLMLFRVWWKRTYNLFTLILQPARKRRRRAPLCLKLTLLLCSKVLCLCILLTFFSSYNSLEKNGMRSESSQWQLYGVSKSWQKARATNREEDLLSFLLFLTGL